MASRNLTKDFVGLRRGEKANQHLNLDNGSENSDNGLLGVRNINLIDLTTPPLTISAQLFVFNLQHPAETTDFQAAHRVVQPEWLDRIDAIEANAGKIEMKSELMCHLS
jgi:hypothetical protein